MIRELSTMDYSSQRLLISLYNSSYVKIGHTSLMIENLQSGMLYTSEKISLVVP
jgi:predicted small integral membrane protein